MRRTAARTLLAALLCGPLPGTSPATEPAQERTHVLEARASAAAAALDAPGVLDAVQALHAASPDDPELLIRLSRAAADAALYEADAARRETLGRDALAAASRAVELAPSSTWAHLSLARAWGRYALHGGTRDRIDAAWKVREHALHALRLDPENDYAHHVLGRLEAELLTQGGGSRFLAGLFVRSLPPASFEDAVSHLRRALALKPGHLCHRIELGLVLVTRSATRAEGRRLLEEGLRAEPQELQDPDSQRRAREALDRLRSDG